MKQHRKRLVANLAIIILGTIFFLVLSILFLFGICVYLVKNREQLIFAWSVALIVWLMILSESALFRGTFQYYIQRGFVSEHNYPKTMFLAAMNVIPRRTMICVFYILLLLLSKLEELGVLRFSNLATDFLAANEYTIVLVLALFQLIDSARAELKTVPRDARRLAQLALLDMKLDATQIYELLHGTGEEPDRQTQFVVKDRQGKRVTLAIPRQEVLKFLAEEEELLEQTLYDGAENCFFLSSQDLKIITDHFLSKS